MRIGPPPPLESANEFPLLNVYELASRAGRDGMDETCREVGGDIGDEGDGGPSGG